MNASGLISSARYYWRFWTPWLRRASLGGLVVAMLLVPLRAFDAVLPISPELMTWVFHPERPMLLACASCMVYWWAVSIDKKNFTGKKLGSIAETVSVLLIFGTVLLLNIVWVQASTALLNMDAMNMTTEPVMVSSISFAQLPAPYSLAGHERFWCAVVSLHNVQALGGLYPVDLYYEQYPVAHVERVQALLGAGDIEGARDAGARLTAVYPDVVMSQLMEAKIAYHDGEVDKALELTEQALPAAAVPVPHKLGYEDTLRWAEGFEAYYSAAAAALEGQTKPAAQDLRRYALLRPYDDIFEKIDIDPAFESFRNTPEYEWLRKTLDKTFYRTFDIDP